MGSFNQKNWPKAGLTSATTSVAAGSQGTTIFVDELVSTIGPNYTEDRGANNALVATITTIVGGVGIHPETGTHVIIKLNHTLQSGANTFNLNNHGADAIKTARSGGNNNLTTAIASGAMLQMIFDGTSWQIMGY